MVGSPWNTDVRRSVIQTAGQEGGIPSGRLSDVWWPSGWGDRLQRVRSGVASDDRQDSRAERPGNTEAVAVVPNTGGVLVSDGRPKVFWYDEPGTATQHTPTAFS